MEETRQFDDYILQEILSRLPAKSLGRFKCTSKRWQDLISNPLLITTHAKRSIYNVQGIFNVTANPQGGQLTYVPLDGGNTREAPNTTLGLPRCHRYRISVKAACNGLLFCKIHDPNRYILGNPSTKSFRHIPEPRTTTSETKFGLAFYPTMSPTGLKVVGCTRVFRPDQDYLYKFTIFSPATNTWRVSSATITCDHWRLFNLVSSVFFNGALHWLREKGDIIAFNVEEERAYRINLPEGEQALPIGGYPTVWFGVVGGKMTLVKFHKGIHVWEMEDYNSGRWEFKGCIETAEASSHCYKRSVPVFYDGERCVLLTWGRELAERRECGLALYRIRTGRWDRIRKLQGWMDRCRHFFPYIGHTWWGDLRLIC